MIEFLTANWLWILLGVGGVWFLFRGMGCGIRRHSHGSEPSQGEQADPHAGHAAGAGATHEHGAPASAPARRRGGCC